MRLELISELCVSILASFLVWEGTCRWPICPCHSDPILLFQYLPKYKYINTCAEVYWLQYGAWTSIRKILSSLACNGADLLNHGLRSPDDVSQNSYTGRINFMSQYPAQIISTCWTPINHFFIKAHHQWRNFPPPLISVLFQWEGSGIADLHMCLLFLTIISEALLYTLWLAKTQKVNWKISWLQASSLIAGVEKSQIGNYGWKGQYGYMPWYFGCSMDIGQLGGWEVFEESNYALGSCSHKLQETCFERLGHQRNLLWSQTHDSWTPQIWEQYWSRWGSEISATSQLRFLGIFHALTCLFAMACIPSYLPFAFFSKTFIAPILNTLPQLWMLFLSITGHERERLLDLRLRHEDLMYVNCWIMLNFSNSKQLFRRRMQFALSY